MIMRIQHYSLSCSISDLAEAPPTVPTIPDCGKSFTLGGHVLLLLKAVPSVLLRTFLKMLLGRAQEMST